MTLGQSIDKMWQHGEHLVSGRGRAGELTDVFAGETWRGLAQFKIAIVAPSEEVAGDAAHRAPLGAN